MSKIIKVVVTTNVAVPERAEIVRIKDTDGVEADYIRVDGMLAYPEILWMEYIIAPSHRVADPGDAVETQAEVTCVEMRSLDEDFCHRNLREWHFPQYTLKAVALQDQSGDDAQERTAP